jgi:hypothetical protein
MPANPFKDQLKKVQAELGKAQKELEAMQEKQRKKPDAGARSAIQEAKNRMAPLQAEEGELLRAISRAAGGRQLGVEP